MVGVVGGRGVGGAADWFQLTALKYGTAIHCELSR